MVLGYKLISQVNHRSGHVRLYILLADLLHFVATKNSNSATLVSNVQKLDLMKA